MAQGIAGVLFGVYQDHTMDGLDGACCENGVISGHQTQCCWSISKKIVQGNNSARTFMSFSLEKQSNFKLMGVKKLG